MLEEELKHMKDHGLPDLEKLNVQMQSLEEQLQTITGRRQTRFVGKGRENVEFW